jgi:Mannosyltransferase (PIG-V)
VDTVHTELDPGARLAGRPDRAAGFSWAAALVATAPAWVAARVIALLLERLVQSTGQHPQPQLPDGTLITGPFGQLLSWDASWYLGLAEHGYGAYGPTGLRFSPLLPLATRAVSALGVPGPAAILLICWVAAFFFGVLVYRLALDLTGDLPTASRAAWLSQLAPGAFALTMGYSEPLFELCAAAFLIAILRPAGDSPATRLWLYAGFAAGCAAGLARPVGLLLALPGLIELVRRRQAPLGQLAARFTVALAPLLGTFGYLAWCRIAYGQFMLPYTVQSTPGLHGGLATDPLQSIWHMLDASSMTGLEMLTVFLVVAALALLWVCARRLPVSLTLWAALMVLTGLTAVQLAGYARYASAAIPLVVAAAMVAKDRRAWAWMLGGTIFAFGYLCYGAFTGWYIP